jgi:hypothetical protein
MSSESVRPTSSGPPCRMSWRGKAEAAVGTSRARENDGEAAQTEVGRGTAAAEGEADLSSRALEAADRGSQRRRVQAQGRTGEDTTGHSPAAAGRMCGVVEGASTAECAVGAVSSSSALLSPPAVPASVAVFAGPRWTGQRRGVSGAAGRRRGAAAVEDGQPATARGPSKCSQSQAQAQTGETRGPEDLHSPDPLPQTSNATQTHTPPPPHKAPQNRRDRAVRSWGERLRRKPPSLCDVVELTLLDPSSSAAVRFRGSEWEEEGGCAGALFG